MDGGRMVVFSSFAAGREQEFNDWYDRIHVPEVLAVGPIVACQRFKVSDAQAMPQTHRYVALYEFVGSAQEAVDALMGATMQMSDTLADPWMSIVEPLGPGVRKAKPRTRAKSKTAKRAPKAKAGAKARGKAKPKRRSKRK
jgi:hypothetical protein